MLTTLLLALAVTGQRADYDLLKSGLPPQREAFAARSLPATDQAHGYDLLASPHQVPAEAKPARPARMIDGERQPTMTYDPGPVVRQVAEPPPDEAPLALDRPARAAPVLSFQSTQATSCYSSSYQAAPSAQAAPMVQAAPATSCYSSSYSAAAPAGAESAPVVTYRAVPAATYSAPVVTYAAPTYATAAPAATYTVALPAASYTTASTVYESAPIAAAGAYTATTRRGLFGGFRQKVRSGGVPLTFSSGAVCTSGSCP